MYENIHNFEILSNFMTLTRYMVNNINSRKYTLLFFLCTIVPITAIGQLKANFTPSSTQGCAYLTDTFKDNSTSSSSPIVKWSWDFGNGNTKTYSTSQNPSAIYITPKTYKIKLTVTDNNGDTSSISKSIII